MDAELKQTLTEMEQRITDRFDQRLDATRAKLEQRLEAAEMTFGKRLEAIEMKFGERLEATETKLLTAFHNWAQTYEIRARGASSAIREFDERLGVIEERLSRLERKRNGGAAT